MNEPVRRPHPRRADLLYRQWRAIDSAVSLLQVRDALFEDTGPRVTIVDVLTRLHNALEALPAATANERRVQAEVLRALGEAGE